MLVLVALGAGLSLAGGGCSAGGGPERPPLIRVLDPQLTETRRAEAVEEAWAEVEAGSLDRQQTRKDFKALAWSQRTPLTLRLAVLRALMSDTTPEGEKDSRMLASFMLPREGEMLVVELLSDAASQRGWADVTPALVRSLSRARAGVPDERRPEYRAIALLHPDESVAHAVYRVFLEAKGGGDAELYDLDMAERLRADAWELLSRLDGEGTLRAEMLGGEPAAASDPAVADLRAGITQLRTVPLTGEELKWLRSLRRNGAGEGGWWSEAAAAIAGLDPERVGKLRLRHAEPVRLAAAYRPAWASASREELLEKLRDRLKGRKQNRRTASDTDTRRGASERLSDSADELLWADVVSILWIDEALHDPRVIEGLFAQAEMDRRDGSTEYGGLLHAAGESGEGPAFRVTLYPPRQATRRGDTQFVASEDMIAQGDHALAHYHFHVQRERNEEYAGPSEGDLAYAARYGRACLVFTSVRPGVLAVDYYQPGGVVIDLGELERPAGGDRGS